MTTSSGVRVCIAWALTVPAILSHAACSSLPGRDAPFPQIEVIQNAPPEQLDTRLFPENPYAPDGAVAPPIKVGVSRYEGQLVIMPTIELLIGGEHPDRSALNLRLIQPYGGSNLAARSCPVVVRWQFAPFDSLDADVSFSIADVRMNAVIRKGHLLPRDARISYNHESGELTMETVGFSLSGLRWVRENGQTRTDLPIEAAGTVAASGLTGSIPALTLHSIDIGVAASPER